MTEANTSSTPRAVAVGDPLGPVSHRPDHVMLFQYSAILWNPHRIHYDTEYARDVAGHPDLVVPGPMQGTFLEQLLTAFAGTGRLVGLRYRNRASAYVGQELTAQGTVIEVRDDGTVRCEVTVTNAEGVTTTAGEGIVAL